MKRINNISYGDARANVLDIYLPQGEVTNANIAKSLTKTAIVFSEG